MGKQLKGLLDTHVNLSKKAETCKVPAGCVAIIMPWYVDGWESKGAAKSQMHASTGAGATMAVDSTVHTVSCNIYEAR
jgi:hypothetical protein